jgi:catechol 2,3-dioxygenase-like lactoylglutathione lyase family enzyme
MLASLAFVASVIPAAAQAPAPAASSAAPRAALVLPSPHIGGVKLHVTDVDKAVRFYQTVFQMKLFNAPANGAVGETMLDFPDLPAPTQPAGSAPEPFLVLVPDPGFVHVNTNVADLFIRVPDVEAVRKRAADGGYSALPGNGLVLKDPSGNLIEVTIQRYFMPAR